MAEAKTLTLKGLEQDYAVAFNDIKKAYIGAKMSTVNSDPGELQQLPITDSGVSINLGEQNITYKKLSTGETWGSKVERDDADINFAVAAVGEAVNEMFMNKGTEVTDGFAVGGKTYKGAGFKGDTKKHECSLWLPAENEKGWIVIPDCSLYGTLNGTDDSNTAYYACKAVPNVLKTGENVMLLLESE